MRSAVLVFCGQAQRKAHECHFPQIQRKYSANPHVIRALILGVRANRDGRQQYPTDSQLPANQIACAVTVFEELQLSQPSYPPECSVASLVSGNR
jgi:hypothetical protein